MVAQSTLRMYKVKKGSFIKKDIKFKAAVDAHKCLKQIKLSGLLQTCAS